MRLRRIAHRAENWLAIGLIWAGFAGLVIVAITAAAFLHSLPFVIAGKILGL